MEVSGNAREYTSDAARLQLVSVRVVDAQPWGGPQRGATLVSVRARGALVGGVLCRFGASRAAAAAAWSAGASRLRCVTAASAASGWAGVQLSSAHGGVSSGGSFYYHAELHASGAAPPLGPERGGTRVAVLGSGLKDAYTLRCRFANASSAALGRLVDASQLECASPMHALGATRVRLSINAQQYGGGGGGGGGGAGGAYTYCLLYTSPSPRDRQKSRMPSSA